MKDKRKIKARTRRAIFHGMIYAIAGIITGLCIWSVCAQSGSAETVTAEAASVTEALPAENTLSAGTDNTEIAESVKTINGRYAGIYISPQELAELEAVVFLEAGNQSAEGQQAVAEVILNRVISPQFPNTVYGVLHQGEANGVLQFTSIKALSKATPNETQKQAINAALYGEPITPLDVVFFSRNGENSRVWRKIGDHVFCRAYKW